VKNGLHAVVCVDPASVIGKTDKAGISDVILESAVNHGLRGFRRLPSMPRTRTLVYRNWLGLMKGDLEEEVNKGGKTLHPQASRRHRIYHAGRQGRFTLKGPAR
jgi:malate synthase